MNTEKKNAVKSSETQILILDFKRSYIPNNLTPNYVKQQFKLECFSKSSFDYLKSWSGRQK